VGRPRLRWEDNIRRDSLLLNIRVGRRRAGDRDIWRGSVEEARARCGLKKISPFHSFQKLTSEPRQLTNISGLLFLVRHSII
jgi:hypothetical protein